MRRFIFLLVFLFIVSGVCAQEFEISGRYGRCVFTKFEESDNWATSGRLISGRVGYHFNTHSALSLDITDIRSNETSYDNGFLITTNGKVMTALAEYTYYIKTESQSQVVPFVGAGFGACQLDGQVFVDDIEDVGGTTDMAYKLFCGIEIAQRLVGEAGYFSGGRNGNTGVVFSLGLCLYIKD